MADILFISSPLFDSDPRAAYFRQAEGGMYVRMALLAIVMGKCWQDMMIMKDYSWLTWFHEMTCIPETQWFVGFMQDCSISNVSNGDNAFLC